METIKVRVTKSKPNYWYDDKIGEEFEVYTYNATMYALINGGGFLINKDHCEIGEPTLNDRFEPLTEGGYEFHLYEEFEGKLYGRIKNNSKWSPEWWTNDGYFYPNKMSSNSNLIPRKSHETIALEKRRAELQAELTEIENKLKEK
jgi:hypothetical protein